MAATNKRKPHSFSLEVLALRDFRLILATRVFGMMALQAQAVIVGWQVYSLTHDPFILGLTGLAEALPALVCALFAGHVVDISRPHRVYVSCIGLLAANTFTLWLFAGGIVTPPVNILVCIFTGVFISGVARSFTMPASFALLPQIVPKAHIPSALAWLGSGFHLAAISGAAIAGIIYGGYGVHKAWLLPAGLMGMAFVMIASIDKKACHYRSAEKREKAVRSIQDGWKFIWKNQVLLAVMVLDMFAVLLGGATAMLPAYADQVLHVGSQGLGALRAAPALGAIVSAMALAVWPLKKIHATTLLWVVTGFGLCMIGFGLSTIFWLSLLLLALSGLFDSVSMVIRGTLMQWLTPDSMRGRVSAVSSMFIISSNELGAFESGLAARLLGLVPSVVFGGIGTLLVVALTAILSPKLRTLVVRPQEEQETV